MEETRILLEQSRASCRASRTLLGALKESLISDKVNWREFDKGRLPRAAPEPTIDRDDAH